MSRNSPAMGHRSLCMAGRPSESLFRRHQLVRYGDSPAKWPVIFRYVLCVELGASCRPLSGARAATITILQEISFPLLCLLSLT